MNNKLKAIIRRSATRPPPPPRITATPRQPVPSGSYAAHRFSGRPHDGLRIRSSQFGLYLGARPDGSVYTHSNCLSWERWWAPVVG